MPRAAETAVRVDGRVLYGLHGALPRNRREALARGHHGRETAAAGDAEIDRYIEREQPFDCAGGFKAEALGIMLFERIDTEDPTAIVGMPLIWLAGALRAVGFAVP